MKRANVEELVGRKLVRGWILDGAGPARFGWAIVHPSKQQYAGRTLLAVVAAFNGGAL